MENQKGMGHITTMISIVIIALLVIGILYYTKSEVQDQKVQNYETDMLLIQGKVKVLSQESNIQKQEELLKGKKVSDNLEDEEIAKLLENNVISQEEEDFSKYYILEKENLEEMGLSAIELDEGYYIVNYKTYEIIYSNGFTIKENTFYKLSELQAYKIEENKEKDSQEENKEEASQEEPQEENNEENNAENNEGESTENQGE